MLDEVLSSSYSCLQILQDSFDPLTMEDGTDLLESVCKSDVSEGQVPGLRSIHPYVHPWGCHRSLSDVKHHQAQRFFSC